MTSPDALQKQAFRFGRTGENDAPHIYRLVGCFPFRKFRSLRLVRKET
jgi:hypothetical protein